MIRRAIRWLLTRQRTTPPACECVDAAGDAERFDLQQWEVETARGEAP